MGDMEEGKEGEGGRGRAREKETWYTHKELIYH